MRLMHAKTWEAENWRASSFQQPGESMHRLPPCPGNVELGPDRHGIAQLWSGGERKNAVIDYRALDVGEVLPFPPGLRPHPMLQYQTLISFAPDPRRNLDDST